MTDSDGKRPVSIDELSELDLTPDWAREEPGHVSVVKHTRDRKSHSRPPRSDDRRPARPRRGRDERSPTDRAPRTAESKTYRNGKPDRNSNANEWRRAPVAMLPLRISFLPDRHGLGIIVRRIRSAKKAFPLPVVAELFLRKSEFYMMKVEVDSGSELRLFQCGVCQEIMQSREVAEEHLFHEHAEEFFDIEVVEGEAPSGAFNCMAVCGLTSTLLGPPNHHTYRDKVREVHRLRFPDMNLADYEQRIKTVNDQESIDAWKIELSRKTQYTLKNDGDSAPLDADAAKGMLIEKRGRELIKEADRFVLPAQVAWSSKDREMLEQYKLAYGKESKFPVTLIHALRPAMKHMRMHLIKVGQRETFVTSVKPSPLDPAESISPIKEVLEYIKTNPRVDRDTIFKYMGDNCETFDDLRKKVLADIHWLVDCGHLIEFSDGKLMLP